MLIISNFFKLISNFVYTFVKFESTNCIIVNNLFDLGNISDYGTLAESEIINIAYFTILSNIIKFVKKKYIKNLQKFHSYTHLYMKQIYYKYFYYILN